VGIFLAEANGRLARYYGAMPLNSIGIETIKIALRVISGDIKTLGQVPEDLQYQFSGNDLKEAAIAYLAQLLAKIP